MSATTSTDAKPKLGELLRSVPEQKKQQLKEQQRSDFLTWFTELVKAGNYEYPLRLSYCNFRNHISFMFSGNGEFAYEFLELMKEEDISASVDQRSMDGIAMVVVLRSTDE